VPYSKEELGPLRPYHAQYGITIGECRGIYREPHPGAIPDEALQDAINARIISGAIVSRGGQAKAFTNAQSGCMYGMIDVPSPEGLFAGSNQFTFDTFQYLGGPTNNGLYARIFDSSSPFLIGSSDIQGGGFPRRNAFVYNRKIYLTDNASTKIFEFVRDISSTGATLYSVREAATFTATVASFGIVPEILSDGSVGDVLYAGVTSGARGVIRWDGVTATFEAVGTGFGTVFVGAGLGDAYAVIQGQGIFKRNEGVWTALAMPAGTGSFDPLCSQVFGNRLWFGGYNVNAAGEGGLISINEFGTVVVERVPTNGLATRNCDFVSDLAIFNSVLVYAWTTRTDVPQVDPAHAYLGTYDLSSFSDTVIDWPTFNAEQGAPNINAILNGDRTLYVMIDWDEQVSGAGYNEKPYLFGISDVATPFVFSNANYTTRLLADLFTLFGDVIPSPATLVSG